MSVRAMFWEDLRRGWPRRIARQTAAGIAWILSGLVAAATYVNVIADDADLRRDTETLARQHAGCADQCRVTRMQFERTVIGYHADVEIAGFGTVDVRCRRELIVAGDPRCRAK